MAIVGGLCAYCVTSAAQSNASDEFTDADRATATWILEQDAAASNYFVYAGVWARCDKLGLDVALHHPGDYTPELTVTDVENAAESALLAARLLDDESEQTLNVYINLLPFEGRRGAAFTIVVELERFLDLGYGLHARAVVWSSGKLGTAGPNDSSHMLNGLRSLLEQFVALYLRVNDEERCAPSLAVLDQVQHEDDNGGSGERVEHEEHADEQREERGEQEEAHASPPRAVVRPLAH